MSLEKAIENISGNEKEWLKKFRQDNLKIFKNLKWEKTKYTSMEFSENDIEITQRSNGFSIPEVPEGVIFTDIFTAIEKHPFVKDYFASEKNKVSSMINN